MTKITTVICDHCGLKLAEDDTRGRGYSAKDPDYCHTCREEKGGVEFAAHRLDELLLARWEKGGFDLTREGVVNIVCTSHDYGSGDVKSFAATTIELEPIDVHLHCSLEIGPYYLKSLFGMEDEYGENGFDICRNNILVGRIRWVKLPDKSTKKASWEHSLAWSKEEPGVLKWNSSQAGFVESLGEAVQLALVDLERCYNDWVDCLKEVET